MDTEANKRAFKHALTKETIPEVGSLIDFHFGMAVVTDCGWIHPMDYENTWFPRAVAEAGEENVLYLYDENHRNPFYPEFLVIKLQTAEGLKWVKLAHPNYNRSGPLTDRTWWCGDYQPTFTHAVEVA